MFRVTAPEHLGLTGLVKPLDRVLADRLQHPEAVALADANQALVDERLERVKICVADCFRRLERAAAREDGEPSEELLLVLGQQLVAPLDRRAQRLLARVDGAAGLEQIQPLREPLDELFGREDSDARRRQLERERQVLEPRAELRYRGARDEARQRCTRPRQEELRAVLRLERRDRIGLL